MYENKQSKLLQPEFVFTDIINIDGFTNGKVSIFIESEDKEIINFSATMDIPLRAVHTRTVQEIKENCIEIARNAFDAQAIIPLLRTPI
ncbi:MAG: hypothetical protein E4H07_02620 [Nitrosomonadales bacterium]|nr:MAG: hypothetical protein E4H07_02620 [Nitrosomonadales bacterium]